MKGVTIAATTKNNYEKLTSLYFLLELIIRSLHAESNVALEQIMDRLGHSDD